MQPSRRRRPSLRSNDVGSELSRYDDEIASLLAKDSPPHPSHRLATRPQPEPPPEGQTPIEEFFYERVELLGEHIRQLREELDTRVELQDYFLGQLDYQIGESAFSLSQLTPWGIGYNSGVDVKRNFLERQVSRLREERRATELRTWQDIVRLRDELRDGEKEYRELTRRGRVFSTGDGDGKR